MLPLYRCLLISLAIGIGACNSNTVGHSSNTANPLPASEKTAGDPNAEFRAFLRRFSEDSSFQASHIKFPLKNKWYDLANDRDTMIYIPRSSFRKLEFDTHHTSRTDSIWRTIININDDAQEASLQYLGIENGIDLAYLFEKINGEWMLVEIRDQST